MLCVLVALVYLYASAGVHMLSSWRQERRDSAIAAALQREHAQLERQRAQLNAAGTLETQARQLGMMKSGEQPYVVGGLPNN
jgi:cell division protein FtsB